MRMTQVGYVYDSTVYYRARYYDPESGDRRNVFCYRTGG